MASCSWRGSRRRPPAPRLVLKPARPCPRAPALHRRKRALAPEGPQGGARAPVPQGHGKTTPWVAGLTRDGGGAPRTSEGARTGAAGLASGAQVLAPPLTPSPRVLRDPRPAPTPLALREALTAPSAGLLFRPPYRPDGPPSARACSQIKALLQQAPARSRHARWEALRHASDRRHATRRSQLLPCLRR